MKGKTIMSKRKLKKKKEKPKFYEIIEGNLVMDFGNLSIEITECSENNNLRIKDELFNDMIIDKYTKSEQILEEAEYIEDSRHIEALMLLTKGFSESLKSMNLKKKEYLNLQKNMEKISQVLKEIYDGYRAVPFLEA